MIDKRTIIITGLILLLMVMLFTNGCANTNTNNTKNGDECKVGEKTSDSYFNYETIGMETHKLGDKTVSLCCRKYYAHHPEEMQQSKYKIYKSCYVPGSHAWVPEGQQLKQEEITFGFDEETRKYVRLNELYIKDGKQCYKEYEDGKLKKETC